MIYEEEDFLGAGVWSSKQQGCRALRPATRAVELDARLQRQPKNSLMFKKFASCFFRGNLVSRSDTLIIAGCSTSGCIRATAVDACQYGFRPMVVREAVGDRSRAAHEQNLFDLREFHVRDYRFRHRLLPSIPAPAPRLHIGRA